MAGTTKRARQARCAGRAAAGDSPVGQPWRWWVDWVCVGGVGDDGHSVVVVISWMEGRWCFGSPCISDCKDRRPSRRSPDRVASFFTLRPPSSNEHCGAGTALLQPRTAAMDNRHRHTAHIYNGSIDNVLEFPDATKRAHDHSVVVTKQGIYIEQQLDQSQSSSSSSSSLSPNFLFLSSSAAASAAVRSPPAPPPPLELAGSSAAAAAGGGGGALAGAPPAPLPLSGPPVFLSLCIPAPCIDAKSALRPSWGGAGNSIFGAPPPPPAAGGRRRRRRRRCTSSRRWGRRWWGRGRTARGRRWRRWWWRTRRRGRRGRLRGCAWASGRGPGRGPRRGRWGRSDRAGRRRGRRRGTCARRCRRWRRRRC